MDKIAVVINAGAGQGNGRERAHQVEAALGRAGLTAHVALARDGEQVEAAVRGALASGATLVVGGGGDGTLNQVASALASDRRGAQARFGVLPLGTLNHFAKDLGIPVDVGEAAGVVLGGHSRCVDVARVNDRYFINNSSIGLYPAVLTRRESTYRRFGRSQLAAYLSVALVLLQPPGLVNLTLTADGTLLSRRTPLLFISTNRHQIESFGIVGAECLEAGQLTLCITRPMGALALFRLAMRALLRGLHGSDALEAVCGREILVGLRRSRVRVALDGEVRAVATPLRYRMLHEALRVLVPHPTPVAG